MPAHGEIDSLQLKGNNANLTNRQIAGIGEGLIGKNPFSATSGEGNTNIGFDRINQSLALILDTTFTEVPMLPILGSNLDALLFEQIDDQTEELLKVYINKAIAVLETRVTIVSVNVVREEDKNKLVVEMTYALTGTNIANQFRYAITQMNGGDIL